LEGQTDDRWSVKQVYRWLEGKTDSQTDIQNSWKDRQMADGQSDRHTHSWKDRQMADGQSDRHTHSWKDRQMHGTLGSTDRCTEHLEVQTDDRWIIRQTYTQLETKTDIQADVQNSWKDRHMTDRQSDRHTHSWKDREMQGTLGSTDRCTEHLEGQTDDRRSVKQGYRWLEGKTGSQTDVQNSWKDRQMADGQSDRHTHTWKDRPMHGTLGSTDRCTEHLEAQTDDR
jgi:hypothetical protein